LSGAEAMLSADQVVSGRLFNIEESEWPAEPPDCRKG
jgi:hypothetical protein